MKKYWLLSVYIILLVLSALVSCEVQEKHEHTYDTTEYCCDAEGHWYGASCEHTDEKLNMSPHSDTSKDGKCDTCGYSICKHSYEESWTSDLNYHWHEAGCGCEVKDGFGAHADGNDDKLCDTCEAYLGGVSDLVLASTSRESASRVSGGCVVNSVGGELSESIYYSFYDNYLTYIDGTDSHFISKYTRGGAENCFAVRVKSDGKVEVNSYEDLDMLRGPELELLRGSVSAFGAEDLVYALLTRSKREDVYCYAESYDEKLSGYSFCYVTEAKDEIYSYEVTASLTDGAITALTINYAEYTAGSYLLDKNTGICVILDDADAAYEETVLINQTVGEREQRINPHAPDVYIITELSLEIGVGDGMGGAVSAGTVVEDGGIYNVAVGDKNGLYLLLPEVEAHKAEFNCFEIITDMERGLIDYPLFIYSDKVGTYPVRVVCGEASLSFTVVVEYTAPTSISAAIVADGSDLKEVAELNLYVNESATLAVIPKEATASPACRVSVSSGNSECVTLVQDGNCWLFSASEAGAYTLTFASVMDESVTASMVINVKEAPPVDDILNGRYECNSAGGNCNSVDATVIFTPAFKGAEYGKLTVELYITAEGESIGYSETAAYRLVGKSVELSHVEGDGTDGVSIFISSDYCLYLEITTAPDAPAENKYIFLLERAELLDTDYLAGEWTGCELSYGMSVDYVISINKDGTGNGQHTSGGAYGITSTFDVTTVLIDGDTVTLRIVTTGYNGGAELSIVFTYSDGALTSEYALWGGRLTITKK